MKFAEYERGVGIDPVTRNKILPKVAVRLNDRDDDFFLLIVGETGTGKSSLSMHLLEAHLGEEVSTDFIAFNEAEFGVAQKVMSAKAGKRALLYDESNVNKRNSMTKWNKDLIDNYFSNRGLNCFHIHCNPSVDSFDKMLLNERVKAVIVIFDKAVDRPRLFYFFKKERLLDIYKKYGNLNLDTIKKVKGAYALYRGWFRDYQGVLKKKYLDKKNQRMQDKVQELFKKYSTKGYVTPKALQRQTGIDNKTIKKYILRGAKEGVFLEGKDFFINDTGFLHFDPACTGKLLDLIHSARGVSDE